MEATLSTALEVEQSTRNLSPVHHQLCDFQLLATNYIKQLILARWNVTPGFLSEEDLAHWNLREFVHVRMRPKQLLLFASNSITDITTRLRFLGSGDLPEYEFSSEVSALHRAVSSFVNVPEDRLLFEHLYRVGKAIQRNEQVDWDAFAHWERLDLIWIGLNWLRSTLPPIEDASVDDNSFYKVGTDWEIKFQGDTPLVFQDMHGFFYLHYLIIHHRQLFTGTMLRNALVRHSSSTPLSLPQDDTGDGQNDLASSDQILDSEALCSLHQRLIEIEEELNEDLNRHSAEASERLHREQGQIRDELAKATGLGNRQVRMSKPAKNDRDTVIKAIQSAIKRISKKSEPLADHLRASISTTNGCISYQPLSDVSWNC